MCKTCADADSTKPFWDGAACVQTCPQTFDSNNICKTCEEMNMYWNGETCVPKTICGEHEDYIPESNTCKCSEGYHEEESKCVEDWVECDENQYLVRDPMTNKHSTRRKATA